MILLDTNFLIGALVVESDESKQVLDWLGQGEVLITAMPAWYEFLCGPVSDVQIKAVQPILSEIVPLNESQSRKAAGNFLFSRIPKPGCSPATETAPCVPKAPSNAGCLHFANL
jgi:hypothetical protein